MGGCEGSIVNLRCYDDDDDDWMLLKTLVFKHGV